MDDLNLADSAGFAEQSTLLTQEDGLNTSTDTVELNGRFGQRNTLQTTESLIKFAEKIRTSPFRSSTTRQSTELSMVSTTSDASTAESPLITNATRNTSDVSFHTPTSVSVEEYLRASLPVMETEQVRSPPVTPARNITHLWKAPYDILEPMFFEVFMNSAKTFAITRDRHVQLRECTTTCLIPYEPVLEGTTYDSQDDTRRRLADQLQGSPTSRTDTPADDVSRQVSYLLASVTTNANIVTPSLTVTWSSLTPLTMTNSSSTLPQHRQVSFRQM